MTIFRRGLKDKVKEELIRAGEDIDNLISLVKVSIDLDDKLYELNIEKRHDHRKSGTCYGPIERYSNQKSKRFEKS